MATLKFGKSMDNIPVRIEIYSGMKIANYLESSNVFYISTRGENFVQNIRLNWKCFIMNVHK